MTIVIRYRWRYFDPVRGQYMVTRYHCDETQIRREHPDAIPLQESRQELTLAENIFADSMSRFAGGCDPRKP